jgi:hypothetical protein
MIRRADFGSDFVAFWVKNQGDADMAIDECRMLFWPRPVVWVLSSWIGEPYKYAGIVGCRPCVPGENEDISPENIIPFWGQGWAE